MDVTDQNPHRTDSPEQDDLEEIRSWRTFPGIKGSIALVFGFLVLQTGFAFATEAVLHDVLHTDLAPALEAALANLLSFSLLLVLGIRLARRSWREVTAFRAFPVAILGGILLAALGESLVLSELGNVFCLALPIPDGVLEMFDELMGVHNPAWTVILLVVVIAPLGEELLFRGLILQGLLRHHRPWVAVLNSAMLFAALHANPWQGLGAFFGGLVLGWLYLRTRSVWPCVILHAVFNLIPTSMVYLGLEIRGYTSPILDGPEFQPWWLTVAGFFLLVGGLLLCARATRRAR